MVQTQGPVGGGQEQVYIPPPQNQAAEGAKLNPTGKLRNELLNPTWSNPFGGTPVLPAQVQQNALQFQHQLQLGQLGTPNAPASTEILNAFASIIQPEGQDTTDEQVAETSVEGEDADTLASDLFGAPAKPASGFARSFLGASLSN